MSGRRGDRRAISSKPSSRKTEAMPTKPPPHIKGRSASIGQASRARPFRSGVGDRRLGELLHETAAAMASADIEAGDSVEAGFLLVALRGLGGIEAHDIAARA